MVPLAYHDLVGRYSQRLNTSRVTLNGRKGINEAGESFLDGKDLCELAWTWQCVNLEPKHDGEVRTLV